MAFISDYPKFSTVALKLSELGYNPNNASPDDIVSTMVDTKADTLEWAQWIGFTTNKDALQWASDIVANQDSFATQLQADINARNVGDDTYIWGNDHTIAEGLTYLSLYTRVLTRLTAIDEKASSSANASNTAVTDKTADTKAGAVSPVGVEFLATGTAEEKAAYTDLEKVDATEVADGALAPGIKSSDDYDTDFFTEDAKVFLEGVEIPFNQCSVSYGVGTAATCTIVLPAHRLLRQLPEATRIHIIFKDPMRVNGVNEWRLLFDGELASTDYSLSPTGANMVISGLHSVSYLEQLQIMFLDVANYMYDPTPMMLGEACFVTKAGFNKNDINIIENLVSRKDTFKSMADIVYLLLYNLIYGANTPDSKGKPSVKSPVGQFIYNKLGSMWDGSKDVPGSWKILKRIYGVSDEAHKAALINKWTTTSATSRSALGAGHGGNFGNTGAVNGNVPEGLAQGINAFKNATMPHHGEGCVDAAVRVGSYYSAYLKKECDKGTAGVATLVENAPAGSVINFDARQLEPGDVIVFGAKNHVDIFTGKGPKGEGYTGNSTDQDQVVEGDSYWDIGQDPTYIIKTSHV